MVSVNSDPNKIPRSIKDFAWVAGFLEGEGYFGYNKKAPAISTTQVQKEPLNRLCDLFGGSLSLRPARRNHQPIWIWHLNGSMAAQVMMTIYVMMSPRRQERIREVLIIWQSLLPKGQRLGKYCLRGHDKNIVGRIQNRCKECDRINKKERQNKKKNAQEI